MMHALNLKSMIIALCMVIAAGLSIAIRPHQHVAPEQSTFDLETVIPQKFGEWSLEPGPQSLVVNPEQEELLHKIYSQILSRTYINKSGYRIMLSIAYGTDQSTGLQLHYPDVCYPAQGFEILSKEKGILDTGFNSIPVSRLMTVQGPRNEPLTYWSLIGDKVVNPGLATKIAKLTYGFQGKISDGLIFRVSSIDPDKQAGYEMQRMFVVNMLEHMDPQERIHIAGSPLH